MTAAFDVLIKRGRLVDGTGNPWVVGDLAVKDRHIVAIGDLREGRAQVEIDARGLVVCPGFIDLHSHLDWVLPAAEHDRFVEPFVRQGVTTVVTGNCGSGPAPLTDASLPFLQQTGWGGGPELSWSWRSMDQFFDTLEDQGLCVNVAHLAGHGPIRLAVMGFEELEPSAEELEGMAFHLRRCLAAGCVGFSVGLEYPPGMHAGADELTYLARVVGSSGGFFACHVRNAAKLLESTEELIEIGRRSGAPVHHSHFQAQGERNAPRIPSAVAREQQARAEGLDITFDMYPWVAGNTTLTVIFPGWSLAGGYDRLRERLRDKDTRCRIRAAVTRHRVVEFSGWENIVIKSTTSEAYRQAIGRSIADLAQQRRGDEFDIVTDLLLQEGDQVGVLISFGREEDLRFLLSQPTCIVGTDAIPDGLPHPAGCGTYPKILGRYVREEEVVPLEEAVRKMTSAAAHRLGLRDRGLVREGMAADITVFDPSTVGTRSTLQSPAHHPEGIEYVLINGQLVLNRGTYHASLRPGSVLRRPT